MKRLVFCSIAVAATLAAANDQDWRPGVVTSCKVQTPASLADDHFEAWQGSANNSIIFLPKNQKREICFIESASRRFVVTRTLQSGSRRYLSEGADVKFAVKGKRMIVLDAKGDEHKLKITEILAR